MKEVPVVKPVFIVGVPRSGTSIFYRKLACHPDFAWLTKTSKKFPRSVFASRFASVFHKDNRHTEGSWIWRKFAREQDDCLEKGDLTPRAASFYRDVFRAQMALFDKPRFLSKYPRNVLRMEFFKEIFPDALFIHVIRDGRAAANSILNCRLKHGGADEYWGIKPPAWKELLDRDGLESCCLQWKQTVEYARKSAENLSDGQYTEIKYEDFVSSPIEVLQAVGEFCDIKWEEELLESLVSDLRSQNYKWREKFSSDQIDMMHDHIGALLKDLGYDV
jgi:hypothetical protein